MKLIISILVCAAVVALSGCDQSKSDPVAPPPKAAEAEEKPALPADFFVSEAPPGALSVSEARTKAKTGEPIVLSGYIGGRAEPFTEGRALFLVSDVKNAPACEDECATPWDACCTPSETIAANSATVQVVDAEGKTLRLDLKGQGGLASGAVVTVVGKVREASETILIVDAEGVTATSTRQ